MVTKKKSVILCIFILLFILVSLGVAFFIQKYNEIKYEEAYKYFEEENYLLAEKIYSQLGNYKNSAELTEEMKILNEQLELYLAGQKLLDGKKYDDAIVCFENANNYKDSFEKIRYSKYNLAIECFNAGDYETAKTIFVELGDYSDSIFYLAQIEIKTLEHSQEILYQKANLYYKEKKYSDAISLFEEIINYKNSDELILECKKQLRRRSRNNILAAGINNSLTITSTKHIKTAGINGYNQLSVNDWENIISIDIYGTLTIGLQNDKTAKIAGTYDGNKTINAEDWYNLIDVAAGEQFVVGLKIDGSVIADGHPSDGQLEVDEWEKVIAIDAGSRFTVGLTENNELLFAGFDNGQAKDFENRKKEWKDVINISASGGEKGFRGGGHTVGLKSDGTLVAVGDNSFGQCDFSDTEKWSDIVKVATGDWYTVGLKSNGTVVMTGENFENGKYIDEEILSKYDNIVDIAAGYGQTMLLTDEGEIICFGFNDENKRDDINGFKGAMIPQY